MRRVSFRLLSLFLLASALALLPRAGVAARASDGAAALHASPAPLSLQGDAAAFWAQGKEYYDAKRYAEAAEAYRQYIRLRPDSPEARYWLASSYYRLKQYAHADAPHSE